MAEAGEQQKQQEKHCEPVIIYRRILVGLDGSHNAFEAFEWYLKNVHRPNDFVIVAYSPNISSSIFNVDFLLPTNVSALSDAVNAAHEQAKDVKELLEERLKLSGVEGRVQMLSGSNIGHAIVKEAEKENVELIVIGCRGHNQLLRTLLGSVSGYVVHHSHIPVLVHPSTHHHQHHHQHQKEKQQSGHEKGH